MPERLLILPVSLLGVIVGPQLVSDVDTVYKVIVGVNELRYPEVFSNLIAENRARCTRISGSCSRAAAFY